MRWILACCCALLVAGLSSCMFDVSDLERMTANPDEATLKNFDRLLKRIPRSPLNDPAVDTVAFTLTAKGDGRDAFDFGKGVKLVYERRSRRLYCADREFMDDPERGNEEDVSLSVHWTMAMIAPDPVFIPQNPQPFVLEFGRDGELTTLTYRDRKYSDEERARNALIGVGRMVWLDGDWTPVRVKYEGLGGSFERSASDFELTGEVHDKMWYVTAMKAEEIEHHYEYEKIEGYRVRTKAVITTEEQEIRIALSDIKFNVKRERDQWTLLPFENDLPAETEEMMCLLAKDLPWWQQKYHDLQKERRFASLAELVGEGVVGGEEIVKVKNNAYQLRGNDAFYFTVYVNPGEGALQWVAAAWPRAKDAESALPSFVVAGSLRGRNALYYAQEGDFSGAEDVIKLEDIFEGEAFVSKLRAHWYCAGSEPEEEAPDGREH